MSTNISKQKREDLIHKINALRTFIANAPQDENTGNLLNYLSELEKDINGKKYGLIFEEHRENIDNLLDTHTPVLTEDKSLFIDNGGDMNFLIEGDNLAALQLLEKTHKCNIDLIYIDPPYNTGNNDFIYDDNYIDNDDLFKHSKWCSFMTNRLKLARHLLNDRGVIFLQISDIELSTLKALCDNIFGESNFINIISVNMKNIAGASGGGEDKKFKKNCEYIIVYAKNYDLFPMFNNCYTYEEIGELVERYKKEKISWKYTSALIYPGDKEYIGSTLDGDGNEIKIFKRNNFIIKSIRTLMSENNLNEKDCYTKFATKLFQTALPQSSIRPRVMAKVNSLNLPYSELYSIEYVPKSGRNKGKIYEQFYKGKNFRLLAWLKDVSETIDGMVYKKTLQGTYWDFVKEINNLTKEGDIQFKNGKKPLALIKQVINLYPSKSCNVLDFFAGSGTTGHAVMQLNKDDNGCRKYILCTNNQNNICRDITYKRLANVINGYGDNTPIKSSLKYYKVDYIPINKKMYYEYADELLKHVRELVELENGINFTHNEKIAIILTDDELSEFISNIDVFKNCETIYLGHDVLPSEEQEEAIKTHNINVNIIPDYYYRNLQEM